MTTEPAIPRAMGAPEHFGGGRYKVLRPLGEGGQKVVYLVRDTALDRDCALALMRSGGVSTDDARRLRNEARALARVGPHPRVVAVFDLGEEEGRAWLVCEYVSGGDLEARLRDAGGPLPVDRALAIARGALEALAFVHAHGIVHRDLKPANLWFDPHDEVKLGDFGLAHLSGRSRVTAVGEVTGTPAYIAPEQLEGREPDGRADLYALGCVLYEMLTGRPPYTGPPVAVISQHLNARPAPPSSHAPDVPPAVDRFVLSLLARSPDDRPASAEAALAELERVTSPSAPGRDDTPVPTSPPISLSIHGEGEPEQKAVPPLPSGPPSPRRERGRGGEVSRVRWLLGLGVAVAALAGGAVLWRARTSAPTRVAAPVVAPAEGRRLAVVAAREGGDMVDGALAWALASRLVEEIDHYHEFRPVSPAGLLAARLAVLDDVASVPDETRGRELARRVGADTVAALSVARAPDEGFSVAVHVFAADDPTRGVTGMRLRLQRADLDGDGVARLASSLLRGLARHWRVARWTDDQPDAAPRPIPFDAWRAFLDSERYCLMGDYARCEAMAREGLTRDPQSALLHIQLACALSYQGRNDESLAEERRAIALRDRLTSRRDVLVLDQGVAWIEAENARARGDLAGSRVFGRRVVEMNERLARVHGDPLGYLYSAAATQYFLEDVPGARAIYAQARRVAPMFYPAWSEDAKLVLGDGTSQGGRREAARLLWSFVTCYPDSELAPSAREQITDRSLPRPASMMPCP